jgi:hypothetical protein
MIFSEFMAVEVSISSKIGQLVAARLLEFIKFT